MPLESIESISTEINRAQSLKAPRSGHSKIQQKSALISISKPCTDLVEMSCKSGIQLSDFRSYRQTSMEFHAKLVGGKVITDSSSVGRDFSNQLNKLPTELRPDLEYAGKGQGLRILDGKSNVFHIQSTPAVAAVLKSSKSLAAQPLPLSNPGRAHLGQASGVQTTAQGSQFRLVDQRLYRFEAQTHRWLPDKDEGSYSHLGLTREGALMKVPQGVRDMSVEGKTQVSLEPWADGFSLRLSRSAGAAGKHLVPVNESGAPVQLTRIGLAGDTLYASTAQGELLRGDLSSTEGGRLKMLPEPVEKLEFMHKGAVSIKGFMHDDNGQLNALVLDARNQLHSNPLTDTPGQAPGWNLSDVMVKVNDEGLPEPAIRTLASAVDLGPRGKVALEGSTLLCWDSQARKWDKTEHLNVDQLERGLDGCAYVLQAGQLKTLATSKSWEPVYTAASHDLLPPRGAQTKVKLETSMAGGAKREITGFAVDNARRFVTLDSQNQLHAHVNGTETDLTLSLPEGVKALALDRQANLFVQTKTGELLMLDKTHWQTSSASQANWSRVPLPDNERLKSLRMGPDQQLIASWVENNPQQNRWGEKFRQLTTTPDGMHKWEPLAPPRTTRASSLSQMLGAGELKWHNDAASWAVTSSVVGHTTEGLGEMRGTLGRLVAHLDPISGLTNCIQGIQHRVKGRAGLKQFYDQDHVLHKQLPALAKIASCGVDMTTRLEHLSAQQSTQALAGTLKESLALVEKNSELLAIRLGDIKGARVTAQPSSTVVEYSAKRAAGSLYQMLQAFENLAPSKTNNTAALLRSYELQGVSLSAWNAEQKRDLDNPTALVESDLIHHALALSKLGELITQLEGDAPDQGRIAEELKGVMQSHHDSPVHKLASQNINSYAQAEQLYDNFKLLSRGLGTPGSALNFHLTRTLGLDKGETVKQALTQHFQQSESGESIALDRTKTMAAGVFLLDFPNLPFFEVRAGVSRANTHGFTISRTDEGASIDIKMNTVHTPSLSLGLGKMLVPDDAMFGGGVRVGVEGTLAVSRDTGASVNFDVKEADFPAMMAILTGEEGNVFGLLDLGRKPKSTESTKTSVDLSMSIALIGRGNFVVPENSDALDGLITGAIGGGASLNLVHFDQKRSVTHGENEITRGEGQNVQLFTKGGASVGAAPANLVALAKVDVEAPTMAEVIKSESSITVSFDRSMARAMRFTFKQPAAVEQAQVTALRDALSRHSPQLKAQLLAAAPVEGDLGEQLKSLHSLFEKLPAPATRLEEHHALENQLKQLIRQQGLVVDGKRELSSVERTVSYVGLKGGAQHEWLDDAAPANKAAILQLIANQPQLAQALKDLERSKGISVSIVLEVKPDVLRTIEDKVGDGRKAQYDVKQALSNTDNLRIKALSASYTVSRTDSITLPTPIFSLSSNVVLSHTQKTLNTEFEYGRDQNVPIRMKLKDIRSSPQSTESNGVSERPLIRDGRGPLV